MSLCSNLPPPALNARITSNGNIADYYCQNGFEMTSGSPRATCVGVNTWSPNTPPVCTLIDNTYQNNIPSWVPIVCASLLGVIFLTCLILAIVYCCCGPRRCCGGNNRTRPIVDERMDDDYCDHRHYETKDYHGNAYYYNDGYSYRRQYDGPYVVPIDYRKQQKTQNKEYVQYVTVEPQQQKTKFKNSPQKVQTSSVPSTEVVSLVKLTNGQLVPLDKYLQDHPGAQLGSLGDQDVVYVKDPGHKTDPKAPSRQAWRANNKRTPPRPVVRSRDSTLAQPVIVTVMNDLNDDRLAAEKDTTIKKREVQPQHPSPQPQPPPVIVTVPAASAPGRLANEDAQKPLPPAHYKKNKDKEKRGKDTKSPETTVEKNPPNKDQGDGDGSGGTKVKDTTNDDKDDDNDRNDTQDSMEPTRAQYVRSGSDLDTSLDDSGVFLSTPPHNTKVDFKRKAFTVRDYNRFRPAKDFPAWRPHTKPVRENNTSTQ